jgi:hypothetical protein
MFSFNRRGRVHRKLPYAHNCRPRLEALEDRSLPSTYAVINTADSGQGSLRQAILDANANSAPNTIIFDIPGDGVQTIQPLSALPAITRPVVIDATFQPGYDGAPLVELDGESAGAGANGLTIQSGNLSGTTVIKGLDINRFADSGIRIQNSTALRVVIQANYIGTDATGTQALDNHAGVTDGGPGGANLLTVGGTAPGAGNLISGNGYGIDSITGLSIIQGNRIGTDITGTAALGNGIGVYLTSGQGTIGGTAANAGNLISGNGVGIYDAQTFATIQGNLIGTDITGSAPLGNESDGVVLSNDALAVVGGVAPGAGNVISGNGGDGIRNRGTFGGTTISGNLIGTDITGTAALGNGGNGIEIANSRGNIIGGTADGAGNVISANGGDGILILSSFLPSSQETVQGNFIGTDISGTQSLGNGGDGVAIIGIGARFNTIGGTAAGVGNTIAFNGGDGVRVDTGIDNAIRGNSIFLNGNLGIELINNGNDNQSAPVLTSVISDGSHITIQGTLTAAPNTTFALDFFASGTANPSGFGDGETFLGTASVTTGADGTVSFTITFNVAVDQGEFISATATNPNGDTSEFAADLIV